MNYCFTHQTYKLFPFFSILSELLFDNIIKRKLYTDGFQPTSFDQDLSKLSNAHQYQAQIVQPAENHRPSPFTSQRVKKNHIHQGISLHQKNCKGSQFPAGGFFSGSVWIKSHHSSGQSPHKFKVNMLLLRNHNEFLSQEEKLIFEAHQMIERWSKIEDPVIYYEQRERN